MRVYLPEEFGLLVTESFLDAKVEDIAYNNITSLDGTDMITIVPGFYGVTENCEIAVFSHGVSSHSGQKGHFSWDLVDQYLFKSKFEKK